MTSLCGLVDDVVTFGSTIADLRGWSHPQRAAAIGCTCPAAAFGSAKLTTRVNPRTTRPRSLQRRNADRDLAETLGFFGECWTNREARFLLQQPPETILELMQAAQAIYGIGYSLGRTIAKAFTNRSYARAGTSERTAGTRAMTHGILHDYDSEGSSITDWQPGPEKCGNRSKSKSKRIGKGF